ncbi:putative AC9 transposase [Purpureocillium lavendulum]|uniref:AC9 transposase n=1 Tax=Purpureocillium lavendulum TaxID=1247861 RepID=A0AB34FBX3_9HYPO|nr:putative AC9 transposase [Purpureocillium lavendulum]
MEGYDKSLIVGFFALPAFKRKYGQRTQPLVASADGGLYEISPEWQMGLQNSALACEIVGLLAHGYITYVIGYRKMMIASLLWLCVAVVPAFFASNITILLVSQAFCGISWGVIQTLAATYAAEVVPSVLRPYVLSNVNMCWVIGQLLGTVTLRVLVHETSEWSYRLPLALQWAWAVPLLIGVSFAPDSPSLMDHTNKIEKHLNYGGATYADLFKGANRRRTEISCMVWTCQALSGAILTGYAPYFFEQAGLAPSNSFNLSTGMYGMAILGGMVSWALLSTVGRRKLYLSGLASAVVILVIGGIVSVSLSGHSGADWALGAVIILVTFTYDLTIGPVCYVLVAEVPSTRLRVKTVALARVAYNIVMIGNNVLTPKMLNPTAWDLGGKSCFLFAGTSLLCLAWCYIRLPETKELSYLELDILFERRAPAAKFRQVQTRLANSAYLSLSQAERLTNTWHGCYLWFEAFDEPWKIRFNEKGKEWEDKWGLLDVNRKLKDGVKIPSCSGQTVSK